jgi:hypothetical protein
VLPKLNSLAGCSPRPQRIPIHDGDTLLGNGPRTRTHTRHGGGRSAVIAGPFLRSLHRRVALNRRYLAIDLAPSGSGRGGAHRNDGAQSDTDCGRITRRTGQTR